MAPERSNVQTTNHLRNAQNALPSLSGPLNPPSVHSGLPPPLPPRQPMQQSYSGYNDYRSLSSNQYGGYQYRGYGGYGGYGGFGGIGGIGYTPYSGYSNYNNYNGYGGHSGDVENRFHRYAEESTRSTFRSIETILQTFSSMTMVLESTYFALTNSFRAILSVSENIGRLRSSFGHFFSTFALIRFFNWIYKKLLHISGIRKQNNTTDDALWEKSLVKINGESGNSNNVWSGILMFSIFVLIPYAIHKITNNVKQMENKGKSPEEWYDCEDPAYIATVLYDFNASNNDELAIKSGQKVCLAPRSLQPNNSPGWSLATDNINIGLIPSNYIKIVGQLKKKKDNMTGLQDSNFSKEEK